MEDPKVRINSLLSALSGELESLRTRLQDALGDLHEISVQVQRLSETPQQPTQLGRYLVVHDYNLNHKIGLIKVIRELTNMGLREAKQLSESPLPLVLDTYGAEPYTRQQQDATLKSLGTDITYCWR